LSDVRIFLELDSESQSILSDNDVTIAGALQEEGIDAKVTFGVAPYGSDTGGKELATIILASGASVALVTLAIAKLLSIYQARPHVLEVDDLVEVRDADGRVLVDRDGKPQLRPQKRIEIHQPTGQKIETAFDVKLFGPHGIVVRLRDSFISKD